MAKQYFKLSVLGIVILLAALILIGAIYTGVAYLVYGVLLSLAFPELPELSFLQYVGIGAALAVINIIFKN